VCLSLLGTWAGGAGEGWDPQVSKALQVLVSIQSLILVADPYFNEPGYQSQMGTPRGQQASAGYNENIRCGTVKYAILETLQHPPPEFAAVVKAHFKQRRAHVIKTLEGWASGRVSKTDVNKVKSLLDKL